MANEQLFTSRPNSEKDASDSRLADRILRFHEVHEKTGLCRAHVHALAAQDLFPKPLKLVPGGRASGWLASEVDAWIAGRVAERDAAAQCGGAYEKK